MEICLNCFEWLALVFAVAGMRYKSLSMSTMYRTVLECNVKCNVNGNIYRQVRIRIRIVYW